MKGLVFTDISPRLGREGRKDSYGAAHTKAFKKGAVHLGKDYHKNFDKSITGKNL